MEKGAGLHIQAEQKKQENYANFCRLLHKFDFFNPTEAIGANQRTEQYVDDKQRLFRVHSQAAQQGGTGED